MTFELQKPRVAVKVEKKRTKALCYPRRNLLPKTGNALNEVSV